MPGSQRILYSLKKIEKARQRAKHFQKDNASVDKPQSLGSFAAAHSVSTYTLKDHWLLNSGSDIHVTNSKSRLLRPRKAIQSQLLAGKAQLAIECYGDVDIEVPTPTGVATMTLVDVAYIPGFMSNLVSLSRLVIKGVH